MFYYIGKVNIVKGGIEELTFLLRTKYKTRKHI
jgi:hypothetical protein